MPTEMSSIYVNHYCMVKQNKVSTMLFHSVAKLNNGIPMCEWLGPGPRQIMSSEKKKKEEEGRNHAWDGKGGNGNAAELVLAAARGGSNE